MFYCFVVEIINNICSQIELIRTKGQPKRGAHKRPCCCGPMSPNCEIDVKQGKAKRESAGRLLQWISCKGTTAQNNAQMHQQRSSHITCCVPVSTGDALPKNHAKCDQVRCGHWVLSILEKHIDKALEGIPSNEWVCKSRVNVRRKTAGKVTQQIT